MDQAERDRFERALHPARVRAFPAGEYVGQESFMLASEIRCLARQAGIAAGVSVLDVCCGVAGPGRLLAGELGCTYVGVDESPAAVAIARRRAVGLDCRFEVAQVPPLPPGRYDVVLLLETLLAFRDKAALLAQVAGALAAGGRFAFTLEEGEPLTDAERTLMPSADTVWLSPLPEVVGLLERVGLAVSWQVECTRSHLVAVDALLDAYTARAPQMAVEVGARAVEELVAAHRLWSLWLREGRARKYAVVARRPVPS